VSALRPLRGLCAETFAVGIAAGSFFLWETAYPPTRPTTAITIPIASGVRFVALCAVGSVNGGELFVVAIGVSGGIPAGVTGTVTGTETGAGTIGVAAMV